MTHGHFGTVASLDLPRSFKSGACRRAGAFLMPGNLESDLFSLARKASAALGSPELTGAQWMSPRRSKLFVYQNGLPKKYQVPELRSEPCTSHATSLIVRLPFFLKRGDFFLRHKASAQHSQPFHRNPTAKATILDQVLATVDGGPQLLACHFCLASALCIGPLTCSSSLLLFGVIHRWPLGFVGERLKHTGRL